MGGSSTIVTRDNQLISINLQSSAYGTPITVLFGTNRLASNLIYYNDFTAIPHTSTTSSGGKGGGGVTQQNTSYTYTATVMFGLCVGPITGIGLCWADKERFPVTDPRYTSQFSLFNGSFGQARWSWLTTNHPGHDYPYSGIAYVASNNYDLGSTGTIKNHSWEVYGLNMFNYPTVVDANPPDIIKGMLTDPYEGIGFPSAYLGDMTTAASFSQWCIANSLFISPAFSTQKPTRQHLADIAQGLYIDFLWSSGVLKGVSYGDTTVTGNGSTFTPNLTPVYDLTDDDFQGNKQDPIEVTRKPNADAYNWVRVKFKDRAQDYNDAIAEAKDQANIDLYGPRLSSDFDCPWITTIAVARQVAQFLLNRILYVRNTYKFKLNWTKILLEPMDLVTLTDSGLGLNKKVVRITKIDQDKKCELTVEAEEWPFGVATPALFTTGSSTGYTPNQNAAPPNAAAPLLFEPPLGATSGQQQVWLATAAGGANWGGANVWVSQDGTKYQMVGVTYGARYGTTTSTLPLVADPDATSTLGVDLTVSAGSLATASASDYAALLTPCWVAANSGAQGEIIFYQTATLTATYKYNLTTMRRGGYGTVDQAHNSGVAFARIDQGIFIIPTPQGMVGKTLYVKLQSFNAQGGGLQSLASLTAYTYTIQGNGAGAMGSPTSVTLTVQDTQP